MSLFKLKVYTIVGVILCSSFAEENENHYPTGINTSIYAATTSAMSITGIGAFHTINFIDA